MPIQTTVKFINEQNKLEYKKMVSAWLESDYYKLGEPKGHFWRNRKQIEMAFDNCNAMVVLNVQKEVVGYMIWVIIGARAEIDIVEVRKDCRRQGICKKMLVTFSNKFTDIYVLSASVLAQAEKAFINMGYEVTINTAEHKKYFKIIRSGLPPFDTLPDGPVIAVCSKTNYYLDSYMVSGNPSKYKHLMKYFQIDMNERGELRKPIITDFYYEGYIGVYFNKKLITEGKAKHLFNNYNTMCDFSFDLLIMNRIVPLNLKLFHQTGFFSQQLQKKQLKCVGNKRKRNDEVQIDNDNGVPENKRQKKEYEYFATRMESKQMGQLRQHGSGMCQQKQPLKQSLNFRHHYWYSAIDIERSLKYYAAKEFPDIDVLTPMVANGIGECKLMLLANLKEYEKQRRFKLSKGQSVKNKIIIPLHINTNHWVLLIINYSKDLTKRHDIYYFDPRGGNIPKELSDVLQDPYLYRGSYIVKLQNQFNCVQNDFWNCGPWIIEAARYLCIKGMLPPKKLNMNQVRKEHEQIIRGFAIGVV